LKAATQDLGRILDENNNNVMDYLQISAYDAPNVKLKCAWFLYKRVYIYDAPNVKLKCAWFLYRPSNDGLRGVRLLAGILSAAMRSVYITI
jgi:hypothetical protein